MLFQHTIKATRESVCMGDDCNAPNARELDYKPDQLFSEMAVCCSGLCTDHAQCCVVSTFQKRLACISDI